jgi:hypothetical protein
MLKIINSYYYNINNNINIYLKRIKTMVVNGYTSYVALKQVAISCEPTTRHSFNKNNFLALDFVLVLCYNTNFNKKIGGIYANS